MTLRSVAIVALVAAAAGCATERSNPVAPSTEVPFPQAQCRSTLAMKQTAFTAEGGSTGATVTSNDASCAWSLTTPEWITATPTSGHGTAGVTIKVQASFAGERTGDVTLGAERIAIVQEESVPLLTRARCHHPARVGSNVGICTVSTRSGSVSKLTVDLSPLGRSTPGQLIHVVAGDWDLDLSVPTGTGAGMYTLTFTGMNAAGRVATISAPLEVR